MAFEKVGDGSEVRFSAIEHNGFIDAALAHKAGRRSTNGSTLPFAGDANTVLVRNDTGVDLPANAVVRLGNSIIAYSDNPNDFRFGKIRLKALKPQANLRAAVTIEPIRQGKPGLVRRTGLVAVQVEFGELYGYASNAVAGADDTAKLVARSGIGYQIVSRQHAPGQTGVEWCIVDLARYDTVADQRGGCWVMLNDSFDKESINGNGKAPWRYFARIAGPSFDQDKQAWTWQEGGGFANGAEWFNVYNAAEMDVMDDPAAAAKLLPIPEHSVLWVEWPNASQPVEDDYQRPESETQRQYVGLANYAVGRISQGESVEFVVNVTQNENAGLTIAKQKLFLLSAPDGEQTSDTIDAQEQTVLVSDTLASGVHTFGRKTLKLLGSVENASNVVRGEPALVIYFTATADFTAGGPISADVDAALYGQSPGASLSITNRGKAGKAGVHGIAIWNATAAGYVLLALDPSMQTLFVDQRLDTTANKWQHRTRDCYVVPADDLSDWTDFATLKTSCT